MRLNATIFLAALLIFTSCNRRTILESPSVPYTIKVIDVQGHRGCRGLLPENTIPAFIHAVELGVTTLEMDVVISYDKEVIVSHEPFFSHEISSLNGNAIKKSQEKNHNIYTMNLDEVQSYDVGIKLHSKFPDQEKMPVSKPTLTEVISAVKAKVRELNRQLPYFNIEIKRVPKHDNTFHPAAAEFASLLLQAVTENDVEDITYIQSFDAKSLEEVHKQMPSIPIVLLVGNKDAPEENLSRLSFLPTVYSPHYKLVNEHLVTLCHSQGVQLIPWTVNKEKEMVALLELGVDGIITDYPDRLLRIIRNDRRYELL